MEQTYSYFPLLTPLKAVKILNTSCFFTLSFKAFGVSHLAMEKLEPVNETVLIQGSCMLL